MKQNKKSSLLNNTRFYILATSILLSIATAAYLRLQIPSDQLYYIRTQQVFGLLCIFYWYLALIISPISYVIGKHRTKRLEFARRAIGVSAAYFATLHAAIALWGQLGGIGEISLLPPLFKWSLAGGAIALFILLIMAATSFDKVVSFMTFRKWKWLYRLVYFGLILAVLHIWTIGAHIAYPQVRWIAFIALAVLSGLELFRTTKFVNDKYLHFDKAEAVTLWLSTWVIVVVAIACMPAFVQNYHSKHTDHNHKSGGVHTHSEAQSE